MKYFIIIGTIAGGIIAGLLALANEVGNYCEELNPYNNNADPEE